MLMVEQIRSAQNYLYGNLSLTFHAETEAVQTLPTCRTPAAGQNRQAARWAARLQRMLPIHQTLENLVTDHSRLLDRIVAGGG